MLGKWRIDTRFTNGQTEKIFAVCRTLNDKYVPCIGNIEYANDFSTDKSKCEQLVEQLNL